MKHVGVILKRLEAVVNDLYDVTDEQAENSDVESDSDAKDDFYSRF